MREQVAVAALDVGDWDLAKVRFSFLNLLYISERMIFLLLGAAYCIEEEIPQ